MNADDLITWMRDQLDADERIALAATAGPWSVHSLCDAQHLEHDPVTEWAVWGGPMTVDHGMAYDDVATMTISAAVDSDGLISELFPRKEREDAEHIARWDPVHVIADIKAKRGLLKLAEVMLSPVPVPPDFPPAAWPIKAATEDAEASAAVVLLKLLALPYADRQGYLGEWLPRPAAS